MGLFVCLRLQGQDPPSCAIDSEPQTSEDKVLQFTWKPELSGAYLDRCVGPATCIYFGTSAIQALG